MSLKSYLTDIADAIRSVKGTTDTINAQDFATEITNLSSSTEGKQKITVIDYDGTILEEAYVAKGDTYTLPAAPTPNGLVFQKWACPIEAVDNQIIVEDYPITIAPIYTSSTTKIVVRLNKVTGLSVTINSTAGTVIWGDGSTSGGGSSFTHTYSAYGEYTITIYGLSTVGEYVFGQSSSVKNYYCKSVILGSSVTTISANAFRVCSNLETVVIPNTVSSIGTYAFSYCFNLKTAIIPSSVLNIDSYAFATCYSGLEYIVLDYGIESIQKNAFQYAGKLYDFIMPDSITTIGEYLTTYCYNLKTFKFSTAFTTMPTSSPIGTCYNLEKIILNNSNITSLPSYIGGQGRLVKEFTIPSDVTTIAASAFSNNYALEKIVINNNKVTTINALFSSCHALKEIKFSGLRTVPTLSSSTAFSGLSQQLKIVVPDMLYESWIAATNWVNYANYIYKLSEVV